jgi:hypothetical protein
MDNFIDGVIVNSERDRRTLDYLIATCGRGAVEQACANLAGQRKTYVSNIARLLGIKVPEDVVITPRDEAKEHLSRLKAMLKERQQRN